MKSGMVGAFAGVLCFMVSGCWLCPTAGQLDASLNKPVGLIQLIEFHDIQGIRNWAYELQQRGMKSLAFIQNNILEAYPAEIKWLADQGHEIAGGHAEQAFWDIDYETQLQIMQETKTLVEQVTSKTMRAFGSRYFAYDENTLKAADALSIEYVLARGTSDVEAIIYNPDEYNCKIINNSGPMCLQALNWLASMQTQYPSLVIEEHWTFEQTSLDLLGQLESQFDQSQGVSDTFGFLPIVFYRDQAFSGFNDDVEAALTQLISSASTSSLRGER